jgi:hypothetical protein
MKNKKLAKKFICFILGVMFFMLTATPIMARAPRMVDSITISVSKSGVESIFEITNVADVILTDYDKGTFIIFFYPGMTITVIETASTGNWFESDNLKTEIFAGRTYHLEDILDTEDDRPSATMGWVHFVQLNENDIDFITRVRSGTTNLASWQNIRSIHDFAATDIPAIPTPPTPPTPPPAPPTPPAATSQEIKVIMHGDELEFDVPPMIINNRTMLPLRAIAEALEADVDWDNATRKVTLIREDVKIELVIDSDNAVITAPTGVSDVALDAPATIVENRTLVPARFISEVFGMKVDWDPTTRTVTID